MTSDTVHTRAPVPICLDEGALLMNLLLFANQHLHARASFRIPDANSHYSTSMAIQCHQMVSGMLQLALKAIYIRTLRSQPADHVRTLRSHPARGLPVSSLSVGLASLDIQRQYYTAESLQYLKEEGKIYLEPAE